MPRRRNDGIDEPLGKGRLALAANGVLDLRSVVEVGTAIEKETENLALRQQIIVLQRTAPKRLCFNTIDRVIFVGLYRLFPDL